MAIFGPSDHTPHGLTPSAGPSQWHPLITRAAATWAGSQATWHHRPAAPEVAATLEFMRFALTTHHTA